MCSKRHFGLLKADPRVQLSLLTHPNIIVFKKCYLDTSVPQNFWIQLIPKLPNLVILNLRQICTDEILRVVGKHCLSLELINAISKVDLQKSKLNASVLTRNVSDVGLGYLISLKRLRVLIIDPPRNDRLSTRKYKYISQTGIRNLVSKLPSLEELRIESCDVGSTLVAGKFKNCTLNLRTMNRHFVTIESIQKLVKLCPHLNDLNLTHIDLYNCEEILKILTDSELCLSRLVLTYFPFTGFMEELLRVKGPNLVEFTLREAGNIMNLNAIILIGRCCPNLHTLRIITQSSNLIVPENFRPKELLFQELECLYIGSDNFSLENILLFFMSHNKFISNLIITYQSKIPFDSTLLKLLKTGAMNSLTFLSLDCTLAISSAVIKEVIDHCDSLTKLFVTCSDNDSHLQSYIKDNNLALTLTGNY